MRSTPPRSRSSTTATPRSKHDWYAFTVAFKGVFLEGLEVAFIVVTIGSAQDNLGVAAVGAAIAFVVVLLVGVVVHRPLSRVPENTLKFGVGVMLTAFGIFWSGEGAGVAWPGRDAALLVLIVFVVLWSAGSSSSFVARPQHAQHRSGGTMKYVTRFARFWYDFVVGDDWVLAVVVVLAVATTAVLAGAGANPWPVLPAAVGVGTSSVTVARHPPTWFESSVTRLE